jgi:hypothetical protein
LTSRRFSKIFGVFGSFELREQDEYVEGNGAFWQKREVTLYNISELTKREFAHSSGNMQPEGRGKENDQRFSCAE